MQEKTVEQLQQQNDRLQWLATHDELTGLLNRRAVEEIISGTMHQGGALLVCDLNGFKGVNDTYGHLMGDACLQHTAEKLSRITRRGDIVGRIGGDEFVIFVYGIQNKKTMERVRRKLEKQFHSTATEENISLSITIGGSLYCEGDTYTALFDRADQEMLRYKELYHRQSARAEYTGSDSWVQDAAYIRSQLNEQITIPGSFCSSFEVFKNIYRFLARCLRRSNESICVVLITLSDRADRPYTPQQMAEEMEALGEMLHLHLRMGDVYTRYSSSQYLLLLIDTCEENGELVMGRIGNIFRKQYPDSGLLLHTCFDMPEAECPKND